MYFVVLKRKRTSAYRHTDLFVMGQNPIWSGLHNVLPMDG